MQSRFSLKIDLEESNALRNRNQSEKRILPKLVKIGSVPYQTARQNKSQINNTKLLSVRQNVTGIIKTRSDFRKQKQQQHALKEQQQMKNTRGFDKHKKLIYESSRAQFYKYYKNLEKNRQREIQNGLVESPFHKILKYIQIYNLPPHTLELVKTKETQYRLNLEGLGLAKSKSIKMLLNVIGELESFQSVNLSKNHIDNNSSEPIISQLRSVENINLSHNKIGLKGINALSNIFQGPSECNILYLNLQSNHLHDNSVSILLESLINYGRLKCLNISNNHASDKSALKLQSLIESSDELEELYLHWNEINSKDAGCIFQALQKNLYIKVLDLSWNRIGNDMSTSKRLAAVFENNMALVHLDLSFCNFTLEESKYLAQALELNNGILGFHFQGNYGHVNHLGSLVFAAEYKNKYVCYPMPLQSKKHVRRINNLQFQEAKDLNRIVERQKDYNTDAEPADVCWICLGYQQVELAVKQDEQVYVHFDFEEYQAIKIQKHQTKGVKRMLPPTQIKFFFTSAEGAFVSEEYQIVALNQSVVYLKQKQIRSEFITKINRICVKADKKMFNEFGECLIDVPVRRNQNQPPSRVFHFENSVFKHWKYPTKDQIQQCFEFDLEHSKIEKVFKKSDDLTQVAAILMQHYTQINFLFVTFATNQSEQHGITQSSALKFGQLFNITPKLLTSQIYLIKFLACITNFSETNEQVTNVLSRSTFMQFLIRIAEQMYINSRSRTRHTYLTAVQTFLAKLKIYTNDNQIQSWRSIRYWNQDNDRLLGIYKSFLQRLYKKYAGSSLNPKSKNQKYLMSLKELKQLLSDCKLCITPEDNADLSFCFDISRMIRIQQQSSRKQIQFVQFLQFLARYSDRKYLIPIGFDPRSFTQFQRSSMPLVFKLQGILNKLTLSNRELCSAKLERFTEKSTFHDQVLLYRHLTDSVEEFNQYKMYYKKFKDINSTITLSNGKLYQIERLAQLHSLKKQLMKSE